MSWRRFLSRKKAECCILLGWKNSRARLLFSRVGGTAKTLAMISDDNARLFWGGVGSRDRVVPSLSDGLPCTFRAECVASTREGWLMLMFACFRLLDGMNLVESFNLLKKIWSRRGSFRVMAGPWGNFSFCSSALMLGSCA